MFSRDFLLRFQRMWQSDPSLEAVYRGLWVPSTHPYQYYTAILVRISDDSTPVNLAKVTCQRVGFEERLTVQGRDIVWIRLQFEDWALVVATVHLESRVNAPAGARNVQQVGVLLQTLRAHCGPKDIVVITGDTNEDANFPPSESPANALYVQDTIDVWSTVHPSDLGYTEDTKINTMRAAFRDEAKFCRLDRVLLLKSEGLRRVRARSIERLGTEAFGRTELGVSVFISDHFGLFAEFEPAAGAIAVGVATPAAGSTPVATPVAAGATAADAAPAAAARPLAAGDSSISSSSSYDSN
eukprot:c4267_g1_i2.p1 GENE.c4267_g1_i2~~c4267_g1_i2.p1  ORF type:complete len:298 (-),score=29.08 c4267_g1_i2:114-1007(-)